MDNKEYINLKKEIIETNKKIDSMKEAVYSLNDKLNSFNKKGIDFSREQLLDIQDASHQFIENIQSLNDVIKCFEELTNK